MKGDRYHAFLSTKRGPKHYKDIWREEDGGMVLDSPNDQLPVNEARGDIEDMHEGVEETNQVSTGPVLARLLSLMRPEGGRPSNDNASEPLTNGLTNGDHMDVDGEPQTNGDSTSQSHQSATYMPESKDPAWKSAVPPPQSYAQMNERIVQELRYNGFFSPEDIGDYDAHTDDEVAARLRHLQDELKKVAVKNGARKARILELTKVRMAQQEYNHIADDLDSQINQAYLKRNRNIGKSKKQQKRPGGPGGGSHPVPGVAVAKGNVVGEQIRTLMKRKREWHEIIGPVVEYGQATIPRETMFDAERMKELEAAEQEQWAQMQDEEA